MKKLLTNKSFNWSMFDQAIVSGGNFLSTVLLARILGLDDFGLFATLWLIILFFNSVHVALIVFPMMSLAPKQKNLDKYFGSLYLHQFLFLMISILIVLLLFFSYTYYFNGFLNTNVIISFLTTLFFYHLQDFYRRYFFIKKYFYYVVVSDIFSYLFRLLFLFGVLIFEIKLKVFEVFIIFTFFYFLGSIIGIIKYQFTFDKTEYKRDYLKHYNLSKWLLPSGLMQWTSVNLFIALSAIIIGPFSVGVIRIGQNIAQAFNIVLQGLENYLPTKASLIYVKGGSSSLEQYILKIISVGITFVVVFSILISFLSSNIIELIYGTSYLEYSYIVIWYAIILVFMYLIIPIRVYLRTIEKTKIWFKAYVLSSIVSIMIVYPLEHYYAINGAMFGILIAHLILIGSAIYYIKKERKYED